MLRTILKSKIQKAVVTECNLEYSGSITITSDI
ncbi:MAG: aspartate 1-decarboxylase, partial [Candidatus Omnitrophica bacterium]|nr:aspartate 1-decarboxylase [Candidatus Omnitrophota bacterium]